MLCFIGHFDFEGNLKMCCFIDGLVDFSETAFPNFVEQLIPEFEFFIVVDSGVEEIAACFHCNCFDGLEKIDNHNRGVKVIVFQKENIFHHLI